MTSRIRSEPAGVSAFPARASALTEDNTLLTLLTGIALWTVLWTVLPILLNKAPPVDNMEQLVWSHGLELGYHKHPPLPTWILIAVTQLVPDVITTTYLLGVLGALGGGYFLWRLSNALLGRKGALLTILATAGIGFYSYRMHTFNHNTVLIPFVYASAWFFYQAVQTRQLRYWMLLAVSAACGLLTKYQFVILPATFAVIALRLGLLRDARFWRDAALAVALTCALIAPHVWWLVTYDFMPFKYASDSVLAQLDAGRRFTVAMGFLLQQVRNVIPVAAMLWFAVLLSKRLRQTHSMAAAETVEGNRTDHAVHVWTASLGWLPVLFMTSLCVILGTKLANHWATTALQFIALPLVAFALRRKTSIAIGAALGAFVIVQTLTAAHFIVKRTLDNTATADGGRIVAFAPDAFSHAATRDWYRVTSQPLKYVVGSTVFGGFVSIYSNERPPVLIDGDPAAAPWIDMTDLARCGAIYVEPIKPPTGQTIALRGQYTSLDYRLSHKGRILTIGWTIVAPTSACTEARLSRNERSMPRTLMATRDDAYKVNSYFFDVAAQRITGTEF